MSHSYNFHASPVVQHMKLEQAFLAKAKRKVWMLAMCMKKC